MNNSNQEENSHNCNKNNYFKITLTIPEELDNLLVEVGQTARSRGGHKLPKTLIIRSLIRLLKELPVNLDEVKTEDQFLEKLRSAIISIKNDKENYNE